MTVPEGEEERFSGVGLIEEEALPKCLANVLTMELIEAKPDTAAKGVAGVVDEGAALALSSTFKVAETGARPETVLVGEAKEDCIAFGE